MYYQYCLILDILFSNHFLFLGDFKIKHWKTIFTVLLFYQNSIKTELLYYVNTINVVFGNCLLIPIISVSPISCILIPNQINLNQHE